VERHFDGWTFREPTGELLQGDRRVVLQSQPLTILRLLLRQPGELVSRMSLIEALWPGGVVDYETALNSAVRRLRLALGDNADHPRYVQTIPKRGYRFVAALSPVGQPAPLTDVSRANDRAWAIRTRQAARFALAAACVLLLLWPGSPAGQP
jgi:DNA-binding winged helix-turn-helix (wHTH) protein